MEALLFWAGWNSYFYYTCVVKKIPVVNFTSAPETNWLDPNSKTVLNPKFSLFIDKVGVQQLTDAVTNGVPRYHGDATDVLGLYTTPQLFKEWITYPIG